MLPHSLRFKISLVILFIAIISGCTKVGDHRIPAGSRPATPYTLPVDAYLAMARKQAGEERQNMLIMAAGRALYEGHWREADSILAQTDYLSPILQGEKQILLAKIDVLRDQPQKAIAKLSAVQDKMALPAFYQTQYHETLAYAYEAQGNATYAVLERIKLERLLADEPSRMANRRILWLSLTRLPVEELNTMAIETGNGNSTLGGWIQLALIARKGGESMYNRVGQWQAQFPNHPANTIMPSPISQVQPYLHERPRQMALLLPITGPLAGPGGAIRDGFMAAYEADSSDRKINIKLYDTASGDVRNLYQKSIAEGAQTVVGPLTKNDVSAVAGLDHPVPTVLLNEVNGSIDKNTYRFGLSLSSEARQVAVKASKNGLKRALIIAPVGAWGNDIAGAFADQWQSRGGVVVESLRFDENTSMSVAVRDLLHVSESQARKKQYRPGAAPKGQEGPKRRQDFDVIFLVAYPTKAGEIMPLLKYYFAGDVPVYATSTVYGGSTNTMRDRDLDGIIFCDMPWVFNHQLANKNWPEQLNSYNRLYAIGMDSYALAMQLNQLVLFPAMGVSENSSVLYLNRGQQVSRLMAWGKFRGGVVNLI